MEKVKSIFTTFFDINSFSVRKLAIAAGIIVAILIIRGILSRLILRIFKTDGRESVKNSTFYKPLKGLFILIGTYAVLLYLGPTAEFRVILDKIFRICIILFFTFSIANQVSPGSRFEKSLKKRLTKANDSIVVMICKTIKGIIYIIGLVILISELGYNISGLIAGIGIGGVAIALAAQDTASNIIGAIMIILDKPFEVGDWVAIGRTEGSIEEITFRSTRIRQAKNCVVSIPNSKVVNAEITNWSKLQKRRIDFNLVIEFNTPLKKLADVQNDILIYLENHEHILNDGMYVKFDKIADDGYNLRTACFTDIIPYADYLSLMDEVNFKIMSILNKHKASLAYKSQTVYFRDDNKK